MSSTPVFGMQGNVPAGFAYDPQMPTYHIEMLSYIQMRNLQDMQLAGMRWNDGLPNPNDLTALQNLWAEQTGSIALQTDELTAIKAGVSQQEAAWLDTLIAENAALFTLTYSADNYVLRRALIDQHMRTLTYLRGVRLNAGTTPLAISIPDPISLTAGETDPMPADLWLAQTALIDEQSDYLGNIKSTYGALYAEIPKAFSVSGFLKSTWFDWMVKKAIELLPDDIPGNLDDAAIAGAISWGAKKAAIAWDFCSRFYNDGINYCDAMIEENNEIGKLPNSRDNYELRNKILKQHTDAIQSLMQQAALAEGDAQFPTLTQNSRPTTAALERLTQAVMQVGLLPPANLMSNTMKNLLAKFIDLLDGDKDQDGSSDDVNSRAWDIKRRVSYLQVLYSLLQQIGVKLDPPPAADDDDDKEGDGESYLQRIEEQLSQLSTGEKAILCPHTGACLYTRTLGKIK